jgi:hypothetical protein
MQFTDNLIIVCCANCDISFGVTESFQSRRRDDHKTFYCPAGHHNVYNGPSEKEKLQLERDRLKQQLAQRDDEIARQKDIRRASERQVIALKGLVTKTKKRVGNGVCPCCNRTFPNLAAHMQTQHKDYQKETA